MNAATRQPIAVLRRAVCGSLAASLLVGGYWGILSPAAANTPTRVPEDPHRTEARAMGGPAGVGGPWRADFPFAAGHWPAEATESWTRPVATAPISAEYGIRGGWAAGRHTGLDFAVPVGTTVRSVGPGEVVLAEASGSYGKAVTVRMDDGTYTLFAHLSKIEVDEGDRVSAGTVLGKSGNTGRSTGPHLHFEVRSKRGYGSDVNPVAYLEKRGVRVV